ncbi:hypothetical protein OsI_03294 [Oryza sativa Indica Group]|uniref:Origin of replication complex subunit 4 n=1 Tax=Oryza sativa subsp. indica TaxID=39946 RepID=B8A7L8_ORYSI|nr:hypothetical protein OsI_03294 [Oryza sativa Indica Group]
MAAAAAAAAASVASQAQAVLRGRLCDQAVVHSALRSSPDTNYSKLKYLVASSVSEACNNSVLLLGPRGCGKAAVVDMVLDDLKKDHPDAISVIRLNGMLHSDDNCATKEIARQLCLEHQLSFSKMASSDDNTEFMIDMLRECGLAHKTIIFVLEEFDLFAQGKQRLLYSLLDAMQSLTSQAVVIGVSCRLDADQLLEKRVRSRFSHRKLLFVPSSVDSLQRLMEHLLALPEDSPLPTNFRVVSYMDIDSGLLSMQSFMNALSSMQRQPKMDGLQDLSILELYILVCMNRLEDKEKSSYNFITIMKEYKSVQDAYKTSDKYSHTVCFRAFEHLLDRELISFADNKGRNQALEYRPVKLLISSRELAESLKLNTTCPAVLQKLLDRERYM